MADIEEGGDIFDEARDLAYKALSSFRRVIEKNKVDYDSVVSYNEGLGNDFAEARALMSRHLHEDEDLRRAYFANITMMIQDCQTPQYFHVGDGTLVGQPWDLSNSECCDALAERLLRLIFD